MYYIEFGGLVRVDAVRCREMHADPKFALDIKLRREISSLLLLDYYIVSTFPMLG
jgi:hypothetical protein